MQKKFKMILSHRVIPFAVISVFFAFSVYKGILTNSSMEDFDLRWLYAAGQCIVSGRSPYDFESFKTCWEIATGDPRIGPFVFLPTSIIYVFPFSFVDWKTAQFIGDIIGVVSLSALTILMIKLASAKDFSQLRSVVSAIFVGLGISSTGIPGSLLVGQPTVATACGLSFLFIYLSNGSRPCLIFGLLLSSIKMHLALFFATFCVLVSIRKHAGSVMTAVSVGLGCSLFMTNNIFDLPYDYMESLRLHTQSEISQLNRPETLLGLKSLLIASDLFGFTISIVFILCVGLFAVFGYIQDDNSLSRIEVIGSLAILLTFLTFQLKLYDLAALAPLYALASRISVSGLITVSFPLVGLGV